MERHILKVKGMRSKEQGVRNKERLAMSIVALYE